MILRRGYEFAPGYRLQEYIGKGQFGEVWRASGPGGVTLAAKFINLEDSSGQKEYAAIKRIKSIRQANLMQITGIWQLDYEGVVLPEPPDELEETFTNLDLDSIDSDSRDNSGFVINPGPKASLLVVGMLLGDVSLEKYVPKRNDPNPPAPVAPGDLLRYLEGTARGLDFLNAPKHDFGSGLVSLQHCDIKPANIVLIGDSAVICDFGLARVLKRSEATMTSAAGTPAYMSPEAINGKPSCNSDQYSLAVTYYHLRTGRLPLEDGSVHKVLQTHLSGTLNFSRVAAIERDILERATHKEWRERYPSNSAFVDAIRVALTEQGLNMVGDGAGPAYGGSAVKPKRRPDGSGVVGLDTLDSEDLTDAFIKESKGGSPIITGSSIPTSNNEMPGQAATEFLGQPEPNGDVDDTFNFDSQLDAAQELSSSQPKSFGLLPESIGSGKVELAGKPSDHPSSQSRWRKPGWLMGGGIAGLAILAFALPLMPSDSEPRPVTGGEVTSGGEGDIEDEATSLFAQSMALIATDALTPEQRQQAIRQFRAAAQTDPTLMTVNPELSLDQHGGEVEVLIPIGSPMGYLTTGYDQDVRWWTWAAAPIEQKQTPLDQTSVGMTLRSTVIAKAAHNVTYAENVRFSADGQTLFVGAKDRVSAWDLGPLGSTDREALPITPAATWTFVADVLALAAHPNHPDRIVASLDGPTAVVVNSSKKTDSEAIMATTDMSDWAKQLRFVGSGEHLIVRQEGGDVVVYDWTELENNRRDRSATKVIQTGIATARDIEVPPVLANDSTMSPDLFCVGTDSGIVSVYQVFGDVPQVERVLVDDDSLEHGITAMTSSWKNADSLMLASGTEQGTVAVHVIQPRDADRSEVVATPLQAGPAMILSMTSDDEGNLGSPVRCLAFSRDGDWLVAGVGDEVWVASLSQVETKMAVFPVTGESVDSVLIDTDHDRVVVGCGDGSLAMLNWSHCRLCAIAGPVRVDMPESAPEQSPPSGKLARR